MTQIRFSSKYIAFIGIVAGAMILASGFASRALSSRLALDTDSLNTSLHFSEFPYQIDGWEGKDVNIPTTTVRYMKQNFADDFLSRQYINEAKRSWVNVYVVYCTTRPAGILGHQPRVCYPGNGWIHDSTVKSQFESALNRTIPCLIHRFHRPAGAYAEVVVLNFYVVNGEFVTDEGAFSGLMGRRPNIAGKKARYVTQVQISSGLENDVLRAAHDMTEEILQWLPAEEGDESASSATAD